MNLHEYQAKTLLKEYGIPTTEFEVVDNAEEAVAAFARMGTSNCVAKAQVHAGGRGQAGGVRLVDNKEDLVHMVKSLIGSRLVTHQTDEQGQPVHHIMIEAPSAIDRELYLGAVLDRSKRRYVLMV